MILGILIQIFTSVILGSVSLLPAAASLPAGFFTAATALAQPLASVAWFLPVSALINVALIGAAFSLGMFILRAVLWVLSALRGTNLGLKNAGM